MSMMPNQSPPSAPHINVAQSITMHLSSEGGFQQIPADSRQGGLYRPFATGQSGGRLASLETLYDFWLNNVPDPDSAFAADPGFGAKLRMQPDVHGAMTKRELSVASMPWRVEPGPDAEDKALAGKIAGWCGWCLRQVESI